MVNRQIQNAVRLLTFKISSTRQLVDDLDGRTSAMTGRISQYVAEHFEDYRRVEQLAFNDDVDDSDLQAIADVYKQIQELQVGNDQAIELEQQEDESQYYDLPDQGPGQSQQFGTFSPLEQQLSNSAMPAAVNAGDVMSEQPASVMMNTNMAYQIPCLPIHTTPLSVPSQPEITATDQTFQSLSGQAQSQPQTSATGPQMATPSNLVYPQPYMSGFGFHTFTPPPNLSYMQTGPPYSTHNAPLFTAPPQQVTNVLLPKERLPNMEDDSTPAWLDFYYSFFRSMVESNQSVPEDAKLRRLWDALPKTVKEYFRAYQTSTDWSLQFLVSCLKDRYERGSRVLTHYRSKFASMQKVANDLDYDNLDKLANQVVVVARSNFDMSAQSQLLTDIHKLLPFDISKEFWNSHPPHAQTLPNIANFLCQKLRSLEEQVASIPMSQLIEKYNEWRKENTVVQSDGTPSTKKPRDREEPPRSSEQSAKSVPRCMICYENHFNRDCPKIKPLSIQQRRELLLRKNVCLRCSKHKHNPSNVCTRKCEVCQAPGHSSILCSKAISVNAISADDQQQEEVGLASDSTAAVQEN